MFKFFLELFVFYIIYKFIFELVLPVYSTTKHIKKKMNEMNEHLNSEQMKYQQRSDNNSTSKSDKSDEYIDYEEVK